MQIWTWCLLYVQSYLEISSLSLPLSCCSALAVNQQYITCLSIYYLDMICFDGLYLKNKLCPACRDPMIWDKMAIIHLGHIEHSLALCDGPLCAQHCSLISFI